MLLKIRELAPECGDSDGHRIDDVWAEPMVDHDGRGSARGGAACRAGLSGDERTGCENGKCQRFHTPASCGRKSNTSGNLARTPTLHQSASGIPASPSVVGAIAGTHTRSLWHRSCDRQQGVANESRQSGARGHAVDKPRSPGACGCPASRPRRTCHVHALGRVRNPSRRRYSRRSNRVQEPRGARQVAVARGAQFRGDVRVR